MKQNEVKKLKNGILELMESMRSFVCKYPKAGLPALPQDFILSEELLKNGEFNLAVCGKVKNGKSSLINALIGRELLPVCNDVATSRVFRISNAKEESFYVVYSNGDRREISLDDLKAYGSQAEIDNSGEVAADKNIAYIQVYTKLDFLPEGVSLLDTPGIGSTYPQHTAITRQNIKMADAAIFVLNPSPMEAIEIDFLKEIAKITPGIIFVTTKVDLDSTESVETAVRSNREKIEKAVGKDLSFGVIMQSMSSELLKDAAQAPSAEAAEFNYSISGYEEVKEAINRIVFLTLGVYRNAQAYNSIVGYYQMVLKGLQNRYEVTKEASDDYAGLLDKYEKANAEFASKMGETQRREAASKIETILRTLESDFNDIFSTKGTIYAKYTEEIDKLRETDIAEYSETLGERIVSDTQKAWDDLTVLVQNKCSDVLMAFNDECMMSVPADIKVFVNPDEVADPSIKDVDLHEKVSKMRTEMFMGTAITSGISTIVGGAYYFLPGLVAPALPVLAPVLVVLGVGAVLWGAIIGSRKAKSERLQKNKNQLQKFLQETLWSCRKQLIETSLANDQYQSLYQGFLLAVREQSNTSIKSIYDKYKGELDAMKNTVVKSKQDPEMLHAIDYLISQWKGYKDTLETIHSTLNELRDQNVCQPLA